MFSICRIAFLIQLASAAAAILAGGLWWRASVIKTPPIITQEQMKRDDGDLIPPLARWMEAIADQSRLNKWAARAACIGRDPPSG